MPFRWGFESMSSRAIHRSAVVPPMFELISPIGTPSAFCRSRPKYQPTAEKFGTVCGFETLHSPPRPTPASPSRAGAP